MNVIWLVMVLGWWRWVCGSSSGDWVMVCACSSGSSCGVVVYMVAAVVVLEWCVYMW